MNAKLFLALMATVMCVSLAGCGKQPEVTSQMASPACAEYEKTTDPVLKAELQKKCPRVGEFKPSPKKSY